jgi:hypothetical protein
MGKLLQQTKCNKCNNSIQSGDKLATQFVKEISNSKKKWEQEDAE